MKPESVRGNTPDCPVQAECGGCPHLHLERSEELALKEQTLSDHLARAGIQLGLEPIVAGRQRLGYRNRLRVAVVDGVIKLVNPVKRQGCSVLRPELWAAIETALRVTSADPTLIPGADHAEVRVGDVARNTAAGRIGLSIGQRPRPVSLPLGRPVDRSELQRALGSHWVIADRDDVAQPTLEYRISDTVTMRAPLNGFVQVNSEVNRLLVAAVADAVVDSGAATFLDLFCGAGNHTLPLLAAGLSGTSVERNDASIAALVQAWPRRGLDAVAADVHQISPDLQPADAVICNPARRGLGRGHEQVAALARRMLVYVGCDPKRLAFDVAAFRRSGFRPVSVTPFDMFPGTGHVEAVAVLTR